MCLQYEVSAAELVTSFLPYKTKRGTQLSCYIMRSCRTNIDWPLGHYGFVISNNPTFILGPEDILEEDVDLGGMFVGGSISELGCSINLVFTLIDIARQNGWEGEDGTLAEWYFVKFKEALALESKG